MPIAENRRSCPQAKRGNLEGSPVKGRLLPQHNEEDGLMYKAIDHAKALSEFLALPDWRSLTAHDAILEFSRFCQAYEDPEVLEDSCVIWQREDVRSAFRSCGVEPDENMVDEALKDCFNMLGWQGMSVGHGREHLHDVALEILDRGNSWKAT